MSSASDLDGQIASAVSAITGIDGRLVVSDLGTDRDRLAPGATRFALSVSLANAGQPLDSNTTRLVADVTLDLHHRLVLATDERAYRLGALLDDQTILLFPTWWKALAAVYAVHAGPERHGEITREGLVVSHTIHVQVSLR